MVEVVLEKPLPGVVVRLDGRPLGATDKNGLLFLDTGLPSNAEVTVVLPSSPQAGSGNELAVSTNLLSPKGSLIVNIPNHVLSAFLQANPGVSKQQGEQRVRQLLNIQQPWSLVGLEESPQSPFSAQAFLSEANKQGGVDALTTQLMQEEGSGKTHSFLAGAALDGDIFGSLVNFAASVATNAVSSEVSGWVTRFIAFALGDTSDQQAQILAELSNIENMLTQQFEQQEINQVYSGLEQQLVTPVGANTSGLYQSLGSTVPPQPPYSAYSMGESLNDLLNQYLSNNYWTSITYLFNTLIGDTGVAPPPNSPGIDLRPERVIAKDIYPYVGIDSVLSSYAGYGAFNNTTLNPVLGWQEYYRQYGVLACNLLAEKAHATVDSVEQGSPTLAGAIRELQLQFLGTSQPGFAALSKAVAQLTPPALPSDQVFVDRENGLMWYMVAKGDLTLDQANQFAASLVAGPYRWGWRVPWVFEVESLYARIQGGWSNLTEAQRQGKKESSVLTQLGFDISAMSDTHHVWAYLDYTRQPQIAAYSMDSGDGWEGVGNELNNVLLVRSYSEAINWYFSDAELMPIPNSSIQIESVQGINGQLQLNASVDMAVPVGGSFTINGKTMIPKYVVGNYPSHSLANLSGLAPNSTVTNKDITSRAVWTSSNDQQALISNMPGEEGTVYWRNAVFGFSPEPVTFTAYFQGQTAQIILSPPSDVEWTLDSMSLTPYQSSLLMNGSSSQDVVFIATLFMKNQANGDRTALRSSFVGGDAAALPVTWTVTDTVGNPIPTNQASFPNPSASVLNVTSALGAKTLKITAASGGVSVSTTLVVVP
ncbi:MAG: hypothetical protein AB1717_08870 [Pseudomonadota bacterium]